MGVSNRPHFNMYKLLVSAALLAAVIADSPPAYAPAPAYHAAPEKLPPQPFAYEYGVADDYNGFIAEVTYEGTPVYPPEPKEGYGHAPAYKAPAYAPAPAYKPAA